MDDRRKARGERQRKDRRQNDPRDADRERRGKQAGREAEDQALAHLRAAGLKLLLRNYCCKAGEIDLVMLDDATLVLAEVRYRASLEFGGAAASVTLRKQRRIVNAAQHLLLTHAHLRRYRARFDVIAVTPSTGALQVEWIKHAFTL